MAPSAKSSVGRGRNSTKARPFQWSQKRANDASSDTSTKEPRVLDAAPVRCSQRAGRGQRNIRELDEETSTAKPQLEDNFPFFNLPREVRDKIYGYMLGGVFVRFHQYVVEVEALYKADWLNSALTQPENWNKPYKPGLASWLTINKRFLLEGVEQFHRSALFWPWRYRMHARLAESKGLFTINKAKILILGSADLEKKIYENGHQDPHVAITFDEDAKNKLHPIIHGLTSSPSALQILYVDLDWDTFIDYHVWFEAIWADVLPSFGPIKQLPKGLRKVTFLIPNRDGNIPLELKEDYHKTFQVMKQELERITGILLDRGQELRAVPFCESHYKPRDNDCDSDCFVCWLIEGTTSTYRRTLACDI